MSDLPLDTAVVAPRNKKERLTRWYASADHVALMRSFLANPAIREAFDLTIEAGSPHEVSIGPDGQATLVAHALTSARTSGWMSALQFLRNLADEPKPVPVEPQAWGHYTNTQQPE